MICEGCREEPAEVAIRWAGSYTSGYARLCAVCSMEAHQKLLGYILADEFFQVHESLLEGAYDGLKGEAPGETSPEEGPVQEGGAGEEGEQQVNDGPVPQ